MMKMWFGQRERTPLFSISLSIIFIMVFEAAASLTAQSADVMFLVRRVGMHASSAPTKMGGDRTRSASLLSKAATTAVPSPIFRALGKSFVKPVLIECGTLVILQSVGIPAISKISLLLRKIRWTPLLRSMHVSRAVLQSGRMWIRNGGKIWHALQGLYKKTSATKVVRETKRILHLLDDHDGDSH